MTERTLSEPPDFPPPGPDLPEPEDDSILRRKLGFRAWHRGTREADLLIGGFADRYLPTFGRDDLLRFERLLGEADPDLYDWMTGRCPVPAEHQNAVTALFAEFRLTEACPLQPTIPDQTCQNQTYPDQT